MSGGPCPYTLCHGTVVLVGHDPETGERLGVCDACDEPLRYRRSRWMSRDEPFLEPEAPSR